MRMDQVDNPLMELRRAVLEQPRNGALRYLLGAELAHQRRYDDAVLEMSAAIALDPLLHIARLQLGLLHLTMAQPHHTVAVLAPLEDLDDRSALKHFKRGLEALVNDDLAGALRHLQRGMDLNDENAPLNRDINLIVERIRAALQPDGVAVPKPAAEQGDDTVRTDFSLYGLTRH
jgi:Flp pilus assembly protein TadD